MDPLLLVNGCSCDSTASIASIGKEHAGIGDNKAESPELLLNNEDVLWNLPSVVPSSPLKRPRLAVALPSVSPVMPSSENASTEDLWQQFNGFLDDDAIIATCQEEPGIQQPPVGALSFSEFVKRYNELSEWLGRIQQSVTTTVGVSRAELYLHKTVLADVAARQGDRRSLNEYGRALLAQRCGPLSDPAMQREIAGYLQSLSQRWQVVERAVTNASGGTSTDNSNQQQTMDQVFVDLEADLELLRQWLDNTEESLASCRLPLSFSSRCGTRTENEEKHIQECAGLLYERCKGIQVQIQSQQRFVSAVRRLSDRLASGSQEFLPPPEDINSDSPQTSAALFQEKAEAYRVVAEELENRWQQLWLVSLEVHCRLENILSGQSGRPRNEIIRPLSGHDLFAAAYSESHSESPGSRSVSSVRSIGFTAAFGTSAVDRQNEESASSSGYLRFAAHCRNFAVDSETSNSLDILPFSENEYEHIGAMTEPTELVYDCSTNLRRTHSEADCIDRPSVKKLTPGVDCTFGTNRNNMSPKRRKNKKTHGSHNHQANSASARRARSENFGSQYQMYFAVSDDSDGHFIDELAADACRGFSHCNNQLALTLPRTASSDSPLPTSADFISTNDTPSSGSGGGADSGRGRKSGTGTTDGDSQVKQQKRFRRQAYNRRRHPHHHHRHYASQHAGADGDGMVNLMQRSHTYNENLVRHSDVGAGDFGGVDKNGRASSLDGTDPSSSAARHHNHKSSRHHRHHRHSRIEENSLSSSLYSSEATESGCSADGEPCEEGIEEDDRLHSTDAVRAAMHRFRWKYCRRGGRYSSGHESQSLSSVDAAHKFSISESAIQELHEIYEAYCAKYSTHSINNVGMRSKQPDSWVSATASSTTTALLPPQDQQAIGRTVTNSTNDPSLQPLMKQVACRSWESENSTLNKTWKKLITLGHDVAAPANFDTTTGSPKLADATLVDNNDQSDQFDQPQQQRQRNGLLRLANNNNNNNNNIDSSDVELSANERYERGEAGDVDWDAYQPPVYTASSDDDDDIRRRGNRLLLSEEGLAIDDDNFLFGAAPGAEDGDGQAVLQLDQEEGRWTPRRLRLYNRHRRFHLEPAASLTSVLEYAAVSLEEVTTRLSNIRTAIRSSVTVDNLASECRQLLEIADDNLAQLQDVHRRLVASQQTTELIDRVDSVVTVWQRVLADLLGEQRRADDLNRALDELHAINDVIPAIEQRLGFPSGAASSDSGDATSNLFTLPVSGIFRFDSTSAMLEASEESLRITASISQLEARASDILAVIQQAGNAPLQEQVAGVVNWLRRVATWNDETRARCNELHGILSESLSHVEKCEEQLLHVEQLTTGLQANLTRWASSGQPDDEAADRLTQSVDECEQELSQVIEPSLSDLESRLTETLLPSISEQAVSSFRIRLDALRARMEGERGRLGTLRVAISLGLSSLSSPTSPKSPASKDNAAQTFAAESSSVDAQTLPVATETAASPEPEEQQLTCSWGRRFAKFLVPAQVAIVSIFLILRFLEPFELPIRVTPLLQFNHGPPPV